MLQRNPGGGGGGGGGVVGGGGGGGGVTPFGVTQAVFVGGCAQEKNYVEHPKKKKRRIATRNQGVAKKRDWNPDRHEGI